MNRNTDKHIFTPETEKRFFTGQILPPLLRGENETLIGIPHIGVRHTMNFLIQNSKRLGYSKLGKYLICYVNPYEVRDDNSDSYFNLISSCLDNENSHYQEPKNPIQLLKKQILHYTDQGIHLVLILAYFDELNYHPVFYNNLHSLYQAAKGKIHFIFSVSQNIFTENNMQTYGQLWRDITMNKIYFPPLSFKDSLVVAKNINKKYQYHLTLKEIELVIKIAGGHPSLIKYCQRSLCGKTKRNNAEIIKLFLEDIKILEILQNIWDSMKGQEKETMLEIVNQTKPKNLSSLEYLKNVGVIIDKNNSLSLFSPLLELFLKNQKRIPKTLSLSKDGQILINGILPEEKISLTEHRLLCAFLTSPRMILSRDKLAETIWPNNSFTKYSDWAIDQHISLLRKKLESMGISSKSIQTIKGHGYRWLG